MVFLLLLLGSSLGQVADAKALHQDHKVGMSHQLADERLLIGHQMGKRMHQPGGRLRILKRPWMPGAGPSWHMMVRSIERNEGKGDTAAGPRVAAVGSSLPQLEEGLRDRRRASSFGVVPFYFRLG